MNIFIVRAVFGAQAQQVSVPAQKSPDNKFVESGLQN